MMRRFLLLGALGMMLPSAVIADAGTLVRPAQLLAEPYVDAPPLHALARDTAVELIERRGGWYRVKTGDGREGWTRLSSVRLGESTAEETGGFWRSLFTFTGRAGTRTASATTGIRGLSETEIRAAAPDAAAVQRLAAFAASESEARRFATEIGLLARDVPPLTASESQEGEQ